MGKDKFDDKHPSKGLPFSREDKPFRKDIKSEEESSLKKILRRHYGSILGNLLAADILIGDQGNRTPPVEQHRDFELFNPIEPEKEILNLINPIEFEIKDLQKENIPPLLNIKEYEKKDTNTIFSVMERARLFSMFYDSPDNERLKCLTQEQREDAEIIAGGLAAHLSRSKPQKDDLLSKYITAYYGSVKSAEEAKARAAYQGVLTAISKSIGKIKATPVDACKYKLHKQKRLTLDDLSLDEITDLPAVDEVRKQLREWEGYARDELNFKPATVTPEQKTAERLYLASGILAKELPGITNILVTERDILRVYREIKDREYSKIKDKKEKPFDFKF